MKEEERKVEWSFDFESVGDRVKQFVTETFGDELEVEYFERFAPRSGAKSASIEIDFSVGRASLSALAPESENLLEARIRTVGDIEFLDSGGDQRQIALRHKLPIPQAIGRILNKNSDLNWDIRLARDIPCKLRIKGGVGECAIDLSQLLVDEIEMDTGIGKVDLRLPASGQPISARIKGGVGETRILVPEPGAGLLHISGGVGSVSVAVAAGAAVRLQANTGLGQLDLPENWIQRSGRGEFLGAKGIWETPEFETAAEQLKIEFDGGIGSFQLETFEQF